MTQAIVNDAQKRMQKSISSLKTEFTKLRSGRAHIGLIDHIIVEYYGNETPLSQVANINVEDARTLSVVPWDKSMIAAIEKAILRSELGLNPSTAGTTIRIPLPALTEERRKEMVKLVRVEAERARVALRNIRRDANAQLKDLKKNNDISEDDERRLQERIQKTTDNNIKDVDQLLQGKEKELMEV